MALRYGGARNGRSGRGEGDREGEGQAGQDVQGEALREIAFPLGGIGTGTISLTGVGGLAEWQIKNRPDQDSINPHSFFALWAREQGAEPVCKVLAGPVPAPFSRHQRSVNGNFFPGSGLGNADVPGLPRVDSVTFRGEYPFAHVDYRDAALPVRVSLEAFNPLIPMEPDDSGIPCAVFNFTLTNPTKHKVDATLALTVRNPVELTAKGGCRNRALDEDGLTGVLLGNSRRKKSDPKNGTVAIATPHRRTTRRTAWRRLGWFDALQDFWDEFSRKGTLTENDYRSAGRRNVDDATLGLRVSLKPGQSAVLPVWLTWSFPVFEKYWERVEEGESKPTWKNHYAHRFPDAVKVARYLKDNVERLRAGTLAFHDALFSSTLPEEVLDAVSSQISILRSTTCIRLPDGTFYGFEGCNCGSGCCIGSCTHVWNYAQALPFLFPSLERSMREADYEHNFSTTGSGAMAFRIDLPLGREQKVGRPAADGQLGGIIKTCREWKFSGDDRWLRKVWPGVVKSLEFAWKYWDYEKRGVIDGLQHNTYDIEFYGPNSMMGSFYLGALRAGEVMAEHLGEAERAAEYRALREKGAAWMDKHLFNGEYYEQKVDNDAYLHAEFPHGQARAGSAGHEAGRAEVPVRPRLPERPDDRPVAQPRRRPRLRLRAGARAVGRRRHLPPQLPREPGGPRQLPARLRHRRRGRAAALHLAARRAAGAALRLLRRGVDRHRVPGGRAPHLRGARGRGAAHRPRGAGAPRRRSPQPMERVRVRQLLRPRHGVLQPAAGALGLQLRRRGEDDRLRPAREGRHVQHLLVRAAGLGQLPPEAQPRGTGRAARHADAERAGRPREGQGARGVPERQGRRGGSDEARGAVHRGVEPEGRRRVERRPGSQGRQVMRRMTLAALLVGCVLTLGNVARARDVQVNVDTSKTHQTIVGFGACVHPGGKAYSDPAFYDKLVFDLGVSILRCAEPENMEAVNDDNDPNHINWAGFDLDQMRPIMGVMQEFKKRGITRFMSSLWSPPAFMKTQRATIQGGKLRADMRDEYAEYMAAFVTAAKQRYGIDLMASSLQNELLFVEYYKSCVYNPQQIREAVRAVMRRYQKDGITTKIMMPEEMMFPDRMIWYIKPTMADPETRNFPGWFDTHRKGDFADWQKLWNFIQPFDRQIWMTETGGGRSDWAGAVQSAVAIHDALVGGNVSAWLFWTFNAIIDDTTPKLGYWPARHFYRFIRPGAVRVDGTSSDPDLLVAAFKGPQAGRLTYVLINTGQDVAQVTHEGGRPGAADGVPRLLLRRQAALCPQARRAGRGGGALQHGPGQHPDAAERAGRRPARTGAHAAVFHAPATGGHQRQAPADVGPHLPRRGAGHRELGA